MAKKVTELKVTTIEELKACACGEIVQLPSFIEKIPFYAKVKRPSLLGLVKMGKIPNTLLTKTNELFVQNGAGFDTDDKNMMAELCDVLNLIAEETLIEPSMHELKQNGIELTDEQLMALFNYSQKGISALESFRTDDRD